MALAHSELLSSAGSASIEDSTGRAASICSQKRKGSSMESAFEELVGGYAEVGK